MSVRTIDLSRACVYEIQEHTKGERAAVGFDENVLRWFPINEPKQKFLLIPIGNGPRFNIVSMHNGEYWSVEEYAFHGSVRLEPAANGDPKNNKQLFTLDYRGDRSSMNDHRFNILEHTRNERVAVGFDGNFIRWSADDSNDAQLFSFIETTRAKPQVSFTTGKFGASPELRDFSPPTELATPPVILDFEMVPYFHVDDVSYSVNQKHAQFRNQPYYMLVHQVYWRLNANQGSYVENSGAEERTQTFEFTSGVKVSESEKFKKWFKSSTEISFNAKVMAEFTKALKGEASLSAKFSSSSGEEIENVKSVETSEGTKHSFTIKMPAGQRTALANWQRIDRWSLINPNDDPRNWTDISLRAKSNGLLVSAFSGNQFTLRAEGRFLGIEDRFEVISNSDSSISLRARSNDRFVSNVPGNNSFLVADGSQLGEEDKYFVSMNEDGTFSIRSKRTGLLVSAFSGNNNRLRAEGRFIGIEDKYEIIHNAMPKELVSWEVAQPIVDVQAKKST